MPKVAADEGFLHGVCVCVCKGGQKVEMKKLMMMGLRA